MPFRSRTPSEKRGTDDAEEEANDTSQQQWDDEPITEGLRQWTPQDQLESECHHWYPREAPESHLKGPYPPEREEDRQRDEPD
jgi:hypothetical protein